MTRLPASARLIRPLAAFGLLAVLDGCVGVAEPVQAEQQPSGYGYTCYAGAYVCNLGQQVPAGSQCSCPGIGAPSFGSVR